MMLCPMVAIPRYAQYCSGGLCCLNVATRSQAILGQVKSRRLCCFGVRVVVVLVAGQGAQHGAMGGMVAAENYSSDKKCRSAGQAVAKKQREMSAEGVNILTHTVQQM